MINPIRRQAFAFVRQAQRHEDNIKYKEFDESTFHERWITDKYGAVKSVQGKQVGGQAPGFGPDVIKFIKQHDPNNSSGAFKDSLNIMEKLQNSTRSQSLMSSIIPLQSILGGNLYSAMKGAGSSAKSQEKTNEAAPNNALLQQIIAAALACAGSKSPKERDEAAEKLDTVEITKIQNSYDIGTPYQSSRVPQSFVDCVNKTIAAFRAVA